MNDSERIAELEREVALWRWMYKAASDDLARIKREYDIPDLEYELDKADYFA